MSEDNPHSSNGSSRSWLEKIAQTLSGEPKNREQLVEVITEAEQRDVINPETRGNDPGSYGSQRNARQGHYDPQSADGDHRNPAKDRRIPPYDAGVRPFQIPVVNEDKDHIEGILLAKDLLTYAFDPEKEFTLKQVLRPAVIVPESKRVDVLLKEFRQKRYHMAIVVDEYGGVSGLVTIEDILELIVGEIEDEHDVEENENEDIRPLNTYTYSVKALTSVEEFNQFFETDFDEEDADTIGGIVLKAFGHMPMKDEEVTLNDIQFKVTNADKRRLIQLKVSLPKQAEVAGEPQD